MKQDRGRPKQRLTVKLDLEWDADVIDWLEAFPKGQRSAAVRDAVRQQLTMGAALISMRSGRRWRRR